MIIIKIYKWGRQKHHSGQPGTCTLNKTQFWSLADLFSEDFLGHPNCSSSVRSWTGTDTPKGWGAPTPGAFRPNRVLSDRVSSGAGSGSSARTASSAPSPSAVHWKTDLAVTPTVLDLSAWERERKHRLKAKLFYFHFFFSFDLLPPNNFIARLKSM